MALLKVKNSNNEWIEIPAIIGAQGPKGDTGDTGPQGEQGVKGDTVIIATKYEDLTFPVAVGTYCLYNDIPYVANQAITTSEAWTAAHWTQVSFEDEIFNLDTRVQALETSPNVSSDLKAALLRLAEKVAYIDNSGPNCYQDLYDALYNTGSIVAIDSISAVLDLAGHTVTAGDTLYTLRPYLTVTATYDDTSTRVLTNYILSGTLAAGTNTITVAYEGETTTFTVTAVAPSVLPTGYTEISSLFSNGADNAYLLTGVMSNDIDYAEYRIMPTNMRYVKAGAILSTTGCSFPYLTGDNTNGERSRIGFSNMGNKESAVTNGSYLYSWNLNEAHTIKGFVEGKVYVDNVELFTVTKGSSAASELQIFKNPEGNGHYFIGRLYWMKFYKNGELYRNYIPCKNSSNVPGLYDTVTDTFISDANSTGEIREGGE